MKKHAILSYLLGLLEIGARDKKVKASTSTLASVFDVSQQSSSRILNELQAIGYVEKGVDEGITWVKLTDDALKELVRLKEELDNALRHPGVFEFEGRLFSGLGEGAYYVSKRPYRRQFFRRLGFDPYPGTLNLRLEEEKYVILNERLRKLKGITILGFEDSERSYGEVKAFRATIDEVKGAVVCAARSLYKIDTLEIIAPIYLRGKLKLEDGDIVSVEIYLS